MDPSEQKYLDVVNAAKEHQEIEYYYLPYKELLKRGIVVTNLKDTYVPVYCRIHTLEFMVTLKNLKKDKCTGCPDCGKIMSSLKRSTKKVDFIKFINDNFPNHKINFRLVPERFVGKDDITLICENNFHEELFTFKVNVNALKRRKYSICLKCKH